MAKDKNKNKNKVAKQPKMDIYNPLQQLNGKSLKRFVNAITKLQYDPQVRALQGEADYLSRQRDSQVGSLNASGAQAQGNIKSYYDSLAQAEANNMTRQQALAQRSQANAQAASQQQADTIRQAGEDANARLNPNSSARDNLQSLIAQQQGSQAREAGAASQALEGQNQNWAALAQAMASANQSRGGQNLSNAARQNMADIASTQSGFNEQIRKVMSELTGTKRDAALAYIKNLYDARGTEREYDLGKQAIDAKGDYNSLVRWQTKQNLKNDAAQRQNSILLANIYGNQKAQSQATQLKLAELYGNPSTKRWRDAYRRIQSEVKNDVLSPKQVQKNRQKIISNLVSKYSFTEAEAKKATKFFLNKWKKSKGVAGSRDTGSR